MPIEPNTKAKNRSVNEIGKPMKITPSMLTSMMRPRTSLASIDGLDLDLLVLHQDLPGAGGPQALHQLGDPLEEQQRCRHRDHRAERPDDRLPDSGRRLL